MVGAGLVVVVVVLVVVVVGLPYVTASEKVSFVAVTC